MNRELVLIVVIALLFAAESWFPFREYLEEKRYQHILRNALLTFVNFLILGIIYGYAVKHVAAWTLYNNAGLFNFLTWPVWLETILMLLIMDVVLYFMHVIHHKIPVLWRLHQVHHSDLWLDFSSATRFHAGELGISAIVRLAFVMILGMSLAQIALFELLVIIFAQFNHANIKLPRTLERFVRLFIVTPDMHQVHHSDIPSETDSNYCTTLSVWDRLFKTYNVIDDQKRIRIGLKQYTSLKLISLWKLMMMPFKK